MKLLFPYLYERYFAKQIYIAFGFILFALVALFLFFDVLGELSSVNAKYTLPLALLHILLKAHFLSQNFLTFGYFYSGRKRMAWALQRINL